MLRWLGRTLAVVLLAGASAAGAQQPPETPQSTIGYDSVEAAMNDLGAKPSVKRSSQNGWLIAADDATRTVWSFAPPGHPAYPTVVRRQVAQGAGGLDIAMAVRCEAAKPDCDELARTFAQMSGFDMPR